MHRCIVLLILYKYYEYIIYRKNATNKHPMITHLKFAFAFKFHVQIRKQITHSKTIIKETHSKIILCCLLKKYDENIADLLLQSPICLKKQAVSCCVFIRKLGAMHF